jgi:HEPN domain-containing protein
LYARLARHKFGAAQEASIAFERGDYSAAIMTSEIVRTKESSMQSVSAESGKKPIPRQVEVDELRHLIHKLRWMGLEQEAETACARLSRISPATTVLAGPHDTD